MKFFGAVAVLVAGTGAWASGDGQTPERVVTACLNAGGDRVLIDRGRGVATQIFKQAGVRLEWRNGEGSCMGRRNGIVIAVSLATPPNERAGAFAYATPFEGTRIVLFYDRVRNAVSLRAAPFLLGYVLAHEIAHLLQGLDRHSGSGIMKPYWDIRDYVEMQRAHLNFTEADILLIHSGLDRRSRPAPAG